MGVKELKLVVVLPATTLVSDQLLSLNTVSKPCTILSDSLHYMQIKCLATYTYISDSSSGHRKPKLNIESILFHQFQETLDFPLVYTTSSPSFFSEVIEGVIMR